MNEVDFIRQQLAIERQHFTAVQDVLADVLSREGADEAMSVFCERCVEYLRFTASRFFAQDRLHAEKLRTRLPSDALSSRQKVQAMETASAEQAAAIGQLVKRALQALHAQPRDVAGLLGACRDYVNSVDAKLRNDSESLYHLANEYYTVEDWRQASLVTADSILEERGLYGAVRTAAPHGATLEP